MRQITDIKEKQQIALGVLKYFADYCTSNKISYSLAYGTLLGAVRHKGFIPWDDDVDVMMLREEYEKFINSYNNESHPYYKLLSMHTNRDYFAPLAKMYDDRTLVNQEYGQIEKIPYGIYIDIFIVDRLPNSFQEASFFYKKTQYMRTAWGLSIRKYSTPSSNWLRRLSSILLMIPCKALGFRYFLKRYDKLSRNYENNNTNYAGIVLFGEGIEKEYMPLSFFYNLTDTSFEDSFFKIPLQYDAYLTQMYGDYMMLPKEEDRKIHPCKSFWK